jgi:hypothetical protein
MKKSLIACVLGIALIASTSWSARAEPITLAVMAVTGITVVALSATTDVAVHHDYPNWAELKNDDRSEPRKQAAEADAALLTAKPKTGAQADKGKEINTW